MTPCVVEIDFVLCRPIYYNELVKSSVTMKIPPSALSDSYN